MKHQSTFHFADCCFADDDDVPYIARCAVITLRQKSSPVLRGNFSLLIVTVFGKYARRERAADAIPAESVQRILLVCVVVLMILTAILGVLFLLRSHNFYLHITEHVL